MDAVFLCFHTGDAGVEQNLLEAFFHALEQRAHQIGIAAGDQRCAAFNDGDLAAQRVIHRTHFQTNDAAADNQQPLGHIGQCQGTGGAHDTRVIRLERQFDGFRTGRNDGIVEGNDFYAAIIGRDVELIGSTELAHTMQHGDFALLGQTRQTTGELGHHVIGFPCTEFVEINLGFTKGDAVFCHFFGFSNEAGGMQ